MEIYKFTNFLISKTIMKKILLSGLVAGLAMTIVGSALNMLWEKVFPGLAAEYATALFRPWSDPLMSLIFIVPFLSGFVFAWIWNTVKGSIKNRVGIFAGGLSILSILGIVMTYSCFPISFLMLATWCVSMIAEYFVGVFILAKMNK